ncbi:alpha/beta hydrolase [Saccharopolyspora sp. NFXS83]|uniref:alpha/beta fold hydrolase n=1 Tax=Saccharopolyspora sp. NFXS83 TaxID=2993560 RepID=UPI00224AAA9D|nr:alpha/beta hydrolase [Saccharopolyspora sp. NFXS83]MCX2734121.1 alpha/beta hydrolase [Saccharopolyspora sp. NFXS83]
MPAVFLNGNPESGAIWDLLRAELAREDVVSLSPPGFGAPIPDGFGCTMPDYRDWLIAELAELGEPVDLVGHDLGGAFTAVVAMARPDLLRTWASDALGVFDPDYVWHHLAQQWQTPGVGEDSVAELLGGTLEERTEAMAARVTDRPVAARLAAAQGPETSRAILTFYRSAVQPFMADLGQGLSAAAARPGLALVATDDHLGGPQDMHRRSATRAGAQVAPLDGAGHWWMVQDPVRSARVLTSFWAEQADS